MMTYQHSLQTTQDTEVFEDLFALLWQYRRDEKADTEIVAHFLVAGCAGENHLWEDMGLPDRETLSRLIRYYFPALYHKNRANMRWKKFFYKQLCDHAEARVCKAPSCGECVEYTACFGPG